VPKPQRRKRGEARCGDGAPDAFVSMVSLAAPPPPPTSQDDVHRGDVGHRPLKARERC
jgi:hypothetical protein